ncbi:MAG: hypothetical protein M1822_004303 [Bathelium mastoideum]|nr:MAG: hypothetical protein M1822_004303 [Bathelium mastoideum]
MPDIQTASAQPKLSRYRSVRKATQQNHAAQPVAQEPPPATHTSDSIIRSRSRYHRPKTAVADPAAPFIPNASNKFGTTTLIVGNAAGANTARLRDAPNPTEEAKERARRAIAREAERQQKVKDDARLDRQARPYVEKAWRVNEVELDPQPDQTEAAIRQNEARKLRAQKRQDAAIARHQQSRPTTAKDSPGLPRSNSSGDQVPNLASHSRENGSGHVRPPLATQRTFPSEKPKRLHREPSRDEGASRGLFGFLRKHKNSDASKLPTPTPTPPRSKLSEPKPAILEPKAENIEPGGGGVVPGTDAPRTAINAGERRVLVECNQSSIQLPVTPETTPSDLVRSAANCLSESINPKASVLLESFSKVGVQRRLRMYEHVRDVMNSWDSDSQNTLLLVESASSGVDPDLTSASVPQEQPVGGSFAMYYSQKPGKWDKRWVTLSEDGQVHLAKMGSSKKETTNVCHLSDFDIYTPTKKQMLKKVKPPKKHCFAVKSQQKSGIFMSTTNFVHFFATGDQDVAAEFYRKVHGWRSWYLINVMGEGKKARKESNPPKPTTVLQSDTQPSSIGRRMSVSGDRSHHRHSSVESHYQIGSFRPLIDPASLDPKLDANAPLPSSFHARRASQDIQVSSETKQAYQRNMSLRNRSNPPVSFPKKLQKEDINRPTTANAPTQASSAVDPSSETTFAPTSLLGRTYSQRQAQQREREAQQSSPFTAGPSLMNGGLDQHPTTTPITAEHPTQNTTISSGGIKRSSSTRQQQQHQPATPTTPADSASARTNSLLTRPHAASISAGQNKRMPPKPLVDLTPTYREPPQHARKGRGFHPDQLGPGGLVEAATSPEDPIAAPASTDWRGRNALPTPTSATFANTAAGAGAGARRASLIGGVAPGAGVGDARTLSLRAANALPLHAANATPRTTGGPGRESGEFARDGLLGAMPASAGWGAATVGRGVMDGAKARGPLLDMSAENKFAKGSLLAGVPDRGPVIERGRRDEVVVGVGEAM